MNEPRQKFTAAIQRAYKWFEYSVSLVLLIAIAVIVVVALLRLGLYSQELLVTGDLMTLPYQSFQQFFGMTATVLIAVEFMNTLIRTLVHHDPVQEVGSVLLIALIVLARKIIVLDYKETGYEFLVGLAILIIATTGAWWLLCVQGRRPEKAKRE